MHEEFSSQWLAQEIRSVKGPVTATIGKDQFDTVDVKVFGIYGLKVICIKFTQLYNWQRYVFSATNVACRTKSINIQNREREQSFKGGREWERERKLLKDRDTAESIGRARQLFPAMQLGWVTRRERERDRERERERGGGGGRKGERSGITCGKRREAKRNTATRELLGDCPSEYAPAKNVFTRILNRNQSQ